MNGTGTIVEPIGDSQEVAEPRRTWRAAVGAFCGSALARGGVLSVVDQAIVSGTSFATAVVIGRLGSQQGLGVYYLALTVVLVARGIQEQVVVAPYQVYSHRRKGRELAEYAGSSLVHQLTLAGLTVLTLAGMIVVFAFGTSSYALAPVALVLLGAAPLLMLRDFVRHFCFAHLHPQWALGVDATVAMLQLGGLIALVGLGWLSVAGVYAVMGVACAVAAGAWLLKRRRMFAFRYGRCWSDWVTNWRFGRWALASYLVGSTTPYILPWMIVAAHDEAATGRWAACMTLVGMANMFVQGVLNYLTPHAAHAFLHDGVAGLRHVLTLVAAMMVGVLGLFCIVVAATGDWLVVFVYGSEYIGTAMPLLLLAATLLMTGLGSVAGNGLWAINRPSLNFAADVGTIIVSVGVGLALIPSLAVTGAAAASLLGATVGAAIRTATLVGCVSTADARRSAE